ncbi:MAG: hypothetical protein RLZZ416_105 [Candidatus Parcubacteria bacterium]|jgi:glutamate racemase
MARVKAIGMFDSGFGGLSVLREVVKVLPQYDYMYLGDNARTPYGTRSSDLVYEFTKQAVDFLFSRRCDLVILACNTASADALRKIQQEYLPKKYPRKRVLGVIVPALEEAIEATKNNRVGVLATEGTVVSKTFPREMKLRAPKIRVFQQAAPLLVPLVEAGERKTPAAKPILENYIRPLLKKNIDTLILGCTHYGHLEKEIKRIVGKKIRLVSEGPVVARKLNLYLERHPEIESRLTRGKRRTFYTTDLSERFKRLGAVFFGTAIRPQKITFR